MSRQKLSMNKLDSIGKHIRKLREEAEMPLRKLASLLDLDQSTLSKIERGERRANIQIIEQISQIFNVEQKVLLINFYSDIISYEIGDEHIYPEILKAAKAKIEYKRSLKQNKA